MTSAALRKILDNDIPSLPKHPHDECECQPTVAYLRVSKIMNREKIVSPTIQLNEIVTDAARNNRRIAKILFDINKSGQDFDRKAFEEVVSDIQAGLYKHVSVWKWSRFGRTFIGSLMMLSMLEEVDAVVDSATEPFEHGTAAGELNRNTLLSIAGWQSKVFGDTWRSVHKTRADSGLPHTGQKRFGYDYISSDERNKRYEINEVEARALRRAYERYAAGDSMRRIVDEINASGVYTSYGNPWTRLTLTRTMESGFAAGLLRSRSAAMKKSHKRRANGTRAGYDVWNQGRHTPIISMELWRGYEAMRDEAATLPPRFARATHPLSALLFCGLCARRLTTKYAGEPRQHRWTCRGRDRFHPDRPVSISNEDAMRVVRQWVTERSTPEWVEQEIKRMHEAEDNARPEAERITAELRKAETQAAKAQDLYLKLDDDNEVGQTRILTTLNALDARVALLKEQRAALVVNRKAPDWSALGVLVDQWDRLEPQFQNAALRAALGMVLVSPPSEPRARRDLTRVKVVALWDMGDWADWLSARRQRST